jgi:hypothetical protein
MSVLVQAISVVIRNSTVEEKYPGGLRGYRDDCPNQTFCADEHLCRVGFMVPEAVGDFVTELQSHGLEFAETGDFTDIAVVDQMTGPTAPCPWLCFGQHPDGYSLAWLIGTDPHGMYVPDGWTVERAGAISRFEEDELDDLVPLKDDNGLVEVLDPKTGKTSFIANFAKRFFR